MNAINESKIKKALGISELNENDKAIIERVETLGMLMGGAETINPQILAVLAVVFDLKYMQEEVDEVEEVEEAPRIPVIDYTAMLKRDLVEMCVGAGLDADGKRDDLIARLVNHDNGV